MTVSKRNFRSYLAKSVLLEEEVSVRLERIAILLTLVTLAVFIVWASFTEIDEVAVAPGTIVPDRKMHVVQHDLGGIVTKLNVQEGDQVRRGQSLLSLDKEALESDLRKLLQRRDLLRSNHELIVDEYQTRERLVKEGLSSRISFLDVQKQRRDLEGEIKTVEESISERRRVIRDQDIVSPIHGEIYKINIPPQRGVIRPSQDIMEIIPIGGRLISEVKILPKDIGHVKLGQYATLKFTSYDFNRYGGVRGKLYFVSPTTFMEQDGQVYYKGRVKLASPYIGNKDQMPVMIGMTLTGEIKTGKKSVMQYLLKPIFSSAREAFRER